MPFADDVNFEYTLDKDYRNITLKVFDLNGKLRLELNNLPSGNGVNSVQWRSTDLPAGNYIYKVSGNGKCRNTCGDFHGKIDEDE